MKNSPARVLKNEASNNKKAALQWGGKNSTSNANQNVKVVFT